VKLLAADVGGTNSRLALYGPAGCLARSRTHNDAYDDFAPFLSAFVSTHGAPDAACFAVAGRVDDGAVWMPNRGWTLHQNALAAIVGAPVVLINDFHAQALAVAQLSAPHLVALDHNAAHPGAPRVVLGAGTGLGEALLLPEGDGWRVVPGEGGHGRFGPRDERELGLLRFLMEDFPHHVSVERVASGPGLVAAYDYLRGDRPRHQRMHTEVPAAVILDEGLARRCPFAVGALEIFIDTFADEAATVAIKCNAGMVFLSGGIAPRLLPQMAPRFRAAFCNKGRYGSWLGTVPVRLVVHPEPGLLGAKLAAQTLLSDG
jgi:glucokinase